jgi:tetratricopeptide (TPR) repeat protein
MQQEYDARPEWFLGEFLLKSLAEAGEKQQLLDLAQRCVQQFERSAVCWAYLGWAQYGAGHLEEALAALDRALGLWLNPQQQEEWHGWRARVLLEIDGREVEAAHSLIQIYLARCSAQTLAQRLRTKTVKLRLQHFQAALKDSDCTAKERRVLLQVAAANLDSDAVEETEILKDHLTQMIRLCREAGAQPILSNYATRFPAFHEVAANLSQQLDVPLADHRQRFRRGLQESPKAALFAAGHPTDRGYEFLAQGVAGVILSR